MAMNRGQVRALKRKGFDVAVVGCVIFVAKMVGYNTEWK